ncbi:MAG: hypothetical protein A2X94_15785 [Bdellovibrionales bacterium GWB1_55_8]|nr:MAG: hypothetical protein A2X94_15785 [Bdellovibrionales bacterium GWB1_55_8]
MIYVSKRQLGEVEYLIHQSIQGHHVLFDTECVRRAFWDPELERATLFQEDSPETKRINGLIEELILQPTLERKRAFLENLDKKSFHRLIRTYFNIVENNLFESQRTYH